MDITCPNCETKIRLVGASELRDEYKLSSNSVQHYRTRGFPEPILTFGNRLIYLRDDVDTFIERRSRSSIERAIKTMMRDLDHLPEKDREEARKILASRLEPGGEAKKSPKRRPRGDNPPRKRRGGQDRPAE